MKNRLLLLISVICLSGCVQGGTVRKEIPVFNMAEALTTERAFDLEEITNEISFVTLDNSILVGNISTMHESHDRLYISDGSRKPIKVFDLNGKFLYTCGSIGRGPTEVNSISAFTVDYRTNNLYLIGGERVITYDSEGHYFARRDSVSDGQNIVFTNGELVVHKYLHGGTPGDAVPLLETLSPELEKTGGADIRFKGSTDELISGGYVIYPPSGIMFHNGDNVFVKETLNDTVFVYSQRDGLTPVFILDMGKNTIPVKSYGSEASEKWDGEVYFFRDIIYSHNYLIAQVVKFYDGEHTYPYIIYDKGGDSGGFVTNTISVNGMKFTPCSIRNDRLIGYVQALEATGRIEGVKEDDNPVIVIAKLK